MSDSDSVANFIFQYPFSSRLTAINSQARLELATSRAAAAVSPHLFEGKLLKPRIAASFLLLLPKLASTRFHLPANMLAKVLALADPVVTCNRDIIRLESFSGCGSAYARVDMASDACPGEFLGKGTTNVDFQQSLRDALTGISADSELALGIGADEVRLSIDSTEFVERKVQLPTRWLRGFAEVATYQASMVLSHDVSKVAATRFLHSLPGDGNDKAEYYVTLRRGELALTQQKQTDGVKVAGLSRLKLLKSVAPYVDRLRIYSDSQGRASAWLIDVGPYTVEYVISASSYRGFSGEGQLIGALSRDNAEHVLAQVRAMLNWQSKIEVATVAAQCGTTTDIVNTCLSKLASTGLVGYDCASGGYFHRELPFSADRSIAFNPRLRGAKRLIDDDLVEIIAADAKAVEARVVGSGATYVVRYTAEGSTCTCVWYAKHQEQRGQCKHILSVQMLMEQDRDHGN